METATQGQDMDERKVEQGRCDECADFVPEGSRFCSQECERAYYQGLEAAHGRAVDTQIEAKRLRFVLECTNFLERVRGELRSVL